MFRKMNSVVFSTCPSLQLTPIFSTQHRVCLGLEVSTLEGLDYVEAVARPGPNVTMSGYYSVFEWFLLYLASLATFPQFCGNIRATLGCPIW